MDKKRSDVAWRIVGLLAGGVVLLAVAVVVLIACGTYIIQEQNDCEKTASTVVPQNEKAEEFDYEIPMDGAVINEHTIVYMESRREFSVNRDSKTGYVTSVLFLDYKKGIMVVYGATEHTCYLYDGPDGDLDGDLTRLRNPLYRSDETVSYEVDERVYDSSELPVEMAPFCSTSNSHWLLENGNRQDYRQKRDIYCFRYCYFGGCYTFCYSSSDSSEE